MARVVVEGVVREAGDVRILDDVSFVAEDGEFVAVVGHSGAGKTSIIRAIAGLDPLAAGSIHFDDDDVTDVETRLRDVSLITETNTLFPMHTVRGNLEFPLWNRIVNRKERRRRVEAESRAHDITHILDRWPDTLSGGEQKLTQIARALVRVPRVFLMDDPLAGLDPPTQRRLREELVVLQRGYGVTTIYTSNRPTEIMSMPDRVVAIEGGRVMQIGTPAEVRRQPATRRIAELTGEMGVLDATVVADGDGFWLVADGMRLRAWAPALRGHVGEPVSVGVRPEHVRVEPGGPIVLTAGRVTYDGRPLRRLEGAGGSVCTLECDLVEGAPVAVHLDEWHLFDSAGARIPLRDL